MEISTKTTVEHTELPFVSQEHFWKNFLSGINAGIFLDGISVKLKDKPSVTEYQTKVAHLDQSLASDFNDFILKYDLEVFPVLQGLWTLLLSRYSGDEDIVFGIQFVSDALTTSTNQSNSHLIPFRLNAKADTLLLTWLHQIQLQWRDLQTYCQVPLSQIQAWSDIPSGMTMFDTVMILGDLEQEFTDLSNHPITIGVNIGSELIFQVRYDRNRFEETTIARLLGHLQTLLESIVTNPNQNLANLSILTPAECHQILTEWNDTSTDYAQDKCIHQLFEEQVERTPDAIAVSFQDQQLTYRELNNRANQLAHYLQKLGVKSDELVGICVERSLEMLVGLLGILKSGCAYVPLDPTYPQERLHFMLQDTQVSVLLTSKSLVTELPEYDTQLVLVDTDWDKIEQEKEGNLVSEVSPESLGYVIYTSGSTGKPKGVQMTQIALCNLILWQLRNTSIFAQAKTLQFSPISFDVSFQEIFSTWYAGGTLVLIDEEMRRDARALLSLLKEQAVERLFLPFVALQLLAEVVQSSGLIPDHLQDIITAGEQLQITPAITYLFTNLPNAKLHNHYGPSESHVVTTFTLNGSVETWSLLPPIGRAISNTQIFILDSHLQPVPIGISGELYIGGVCLARGYLNRPELTAEKFIPNPFNLEEVPYLYKTGDLARYLECGDIEYLGRIDNQVKIRGFRIELGEIESILSQHPNIRATVVTVREDIPSDKRLIAYVVAEDQSQDIDLRSFLKERLPSYMVPSAFVCLETIPITPNGKIDYRNLPAPDTFNTQLDTEFVPPSNPTEESLANIWTDVLSLERVGINDNFFDLGGHSLLAIQVISRCRQLFLVEIPLQILFEKPTIAQLSDHIRTLEKATRLIIQPTSRNQPLPLSFAQQRLWFLDQLESNSSFYNLPEAIRLQGELKINILQQALDSIVAHYEILRTNYIAENGNPIQSITPSRSVELKIFDFQEYETVEQEIQIQKVLQQESQYPFNLASDLMIRGCLLKLSSSEQILLIVQHHIATDGWSMGIMWEKLTQLYLAFLEGKPNPLITLPIQYADYAVWQREWLLGEVIDKQLNYWKHQLANANPLLELPTDHPRPSVKTYRGDCQTYSLPPRLSLDVNQLCRQERITLYMTLLAAFQVLMHRYSRQEDIVIGSVIAGRNQIEVEKLIGFFVNTLVLRNDLSGNPSFKELLSKVRSTTLDAYTHQDLPFEKLVEELNPERSLSYNPLFQVMFVLQNTPTQTDKLLGLETKLVSIETSTTKFDLDLSIEEKSGALVASWTYNVELFNADTIERMHEHFQTLLEGIVANPNKPIDQLPMLTEKERHQILTEWNDTSTDYPQDKCIHQLFEEQVERTPDAIAVSFQDQQLTYRELNKRANQLAHYLQNLGVKPDVLVGICVERSLEMIVGLLGILKAGGAYVPLDPSYPSERLAHMLSDSQMTVLVTQHDLVSILPEHEAKIVCLDTDRNIVSQEIEENLLSDATPDQLIYVIYTSGSTGKPKGVETTHRGVARLLLGVNYINLNSENKFLQIAPISFDASTLEIWGALLFGAQCVLFPEKVPTSTDLRKVIQKHGITTMWLTSALFNSIVDTDPKALEGIRELFTGGEALSVNHVERAIKALPSTQIVNGYGPTESTTFACCYPIPKKLDKSIQSIPIGRPIGNTQIYILDNNLQPVPIGISGEIYIGGAGLARGYLNRQDLTEAKFVHNPFGAGRLYQTGDFARYKNNGDIEFLGRIDNQVKIRGFRIELGEIETVLSQHPNIRVTVVTVREDIPNDKRVVAYVVAEDQCQDIDLRSFLKERLPIYMIPSAFVFLETIPITPNGKIDYRNLPSPDTSSTQLEKNFVPPSNPTQETLAKIWSQILGVERVGINDNFFELGGNSLLSVRLISEIEKAFNYQIPLSSFFKISTIAEIEDLISSQTQESIFDQESSLGLNLDDFRALISHSAGKTGLRLGKRGLIINILPDSQTSQTMSKPFVWIGEGRTSKKLKLNRPVYVMPGASLSISMNSHDDYISTISTLLVDELLSIQPSGSYSLGGWCYNGLVALEMAQQLRNMGKQVDLVSLIDASGKSKLFKFAHKVNSSVGTLRFHLFQISKLSLKDKWHYIKARVKRSQSDSDNLNSETKKGEFKFDQEADYVLEKAYKDYSPRHYSGRILLIVGSEQVVHGQKDIKHFDLSWLFPNFGWGDLFQGKVHLAKIKCDHLELMEEPFCEEVGQIIQTIEDLI
jgi:amino acid adenylation domain-containing protein